MARDATGNDKAPRVSDETAAAEQEEAAAEHGADRNATTEEEAADRARDDPAIAGDQKAVGSSYRDMAERGATDKGEGRIG